MRQHAGTPPDHSGVAGFRFQVLGPVRAWRDGVEIPLGPAKQRAVLAFLSLSPREPVPRDAIIEFLWPDAPPPSAVNAVQTYVKRLRQILEPDRPPRAPSALLLSAHGGYLLAVDDDQVDLTRFRRLVAAAAEARRLADDAAAAELLRQAIGLWRGRPGQGLGVVAGLHPKMTGVEQELLGAAVDCADAELRAGRIAETLPRLEELAGAYPLHEPLQARLVRAYHSCGRPAEALAAFERVRARLRDDLGVDPGPELRRAHQTVLHADARPRPVIERWTGRRPTPEPLVGRARDLAQLTETLPVRRLVTLTGAGGAGKTVLALAVAQRLAPDYDDGVAVVELGRLPPEAEQEPPGHENAVAEAVRGALGISGAARGGIRNHVAAHLQGRRMLLVLDNAEHVVRTTARFVDHLARACPSVHLLVTSRRPLGVAGETLWAVAPLAVPDADTPAAALVSFPAVELFLRRVAESCPGLDLSAELPLVSRLCRRLDGLPLAIELAAARLRAMSLTDLATRLSGNLSLLARADTAALPHQRTLETTIEWSRRLLTPWQRLLLGRLAVFAGAFTLDAAEQVCGFDPLTRSDVASTLAELVDSSLVRSTRDGDHYRYRLPPPVRELALSRVAPRELRAASRRHLLRCVDAARNLGTIPDDRRLAMVREEIDDIFTALAFAFDASADATRWELGARLLAGNRAVWDADPGNLDAVRRWTLRALERAASLPRPVRVRLLHWAGRLSYVTGRLPAARAHLAAALAEYDLADPEERRLRVDALTGLAAVSDRMADRRAIEAAWRTVAAARETEDRDVVVRALTNMGHLVAQWGEVSEGLAAVAEARRLARGNPTLLRSCDYREATIQVWARRPRRSLTVSARLRAGADRLAPTARVDLLTYRGWAHALLGDLGTARTELTTALRHVRDSGRLLLRAYPLHALAYVELADGRVDLARAHLRRCLESCLTTPDLLTAVHAVNLTAILTRRAGAPDQEIAALAHLCHERSGLPGWPFAPQEVLVGPGILAGGEREDLDGVQSLITHAAEAALELLAAHPVTRLRPREGLADRRGPRLPAPPLS